MNIEIIPNPSGNFAWTVRPDACDLIWISASLKRIVVLADAKTIELDHLSTRDRALLKATLIHALQILEGEGL